MAQTPESEPGAAHPALDAEVVLSTLLAQSGVGLTIVDRDLRIVRANNVFGMIEGTPAELTGRSIAVLVPHAASDIVPATLAVLESGMPAAAQELAIRNPDDPEEVRYFRTFRSPVVAADGTIAGVVSTVIEITDLRAVQIERDDAVARQRESDRAELASRRSEQAAQLRYRTIFDAASIGIIRVDRTGRVVEVNPALEQMLGYSVAELAVMKFQEYTHADDVAENLRHFDAIMNGPEHSYQFEKRCFRKDGSMIWVRVNSAAEFEDDGSRQYAITMLEDITERRLAEEAHREQALLSAHQATHDALTELANRRKLYTDVECALAEPDGRTFALGLFDLDGFKAYNDAFGHPAGDALLARLGRRLAETVDGRGTAYRMGGDEFCVFTSAPEPMRVLDDAETALCEQGEGFAIRCSRGAALLPADAGDLEGALQIGDERLYADKRRNRTGDSEQVGSALAQLVAERRHDPPRDGVNLAELAAATATRLGLSREDVMCARIAAEVHDIGKSALPESILCKAGPLEGDERAFIERHAIVGERILASSPTLARVAPIVRASHERPDGTGYPDGLTADGIPIGGRIIAVVDAFEAMISRRPYRTPMSAGEAVAELRRCTGTQFDASVVEAFALVVAESDPASRAA